MTAASRVWKRFMEVGGVTTEVLGLNAITEKASLQVIIIPGNPGSAAYFTPFIEYLHRGLGGRADIQAVTHAGHDTETNHGGRVWSLAEQVSHKAAFLRSHALLPGRPPAVLLGHSIGAWMAVKAVEQLEGRAVSGGAEGGAEVPNPLTSLPPAVIPAATAGEELPAILKLVAIFPFFETNFGGSARQRSLAVLTRHHGLMGGLAAALGTVLPQWLRRAMANMAEDHDPHAAELSAALVRRDTVRNAFYMAAHEFKDLCPPPGCPEPPLLPLLRRLAPRLWVMGCEEDVWLSREQYEALVGALPGMQSSWHPSLRHAFCISLRQSAEAARAIGEGLAHLLPAHDTQHGTQHGTQHDTNGTLHHTVRHDTVSPAGDAQGGAAAAVAVAADASAPAALEGREAPVSRL